MPRIPRRRKRRSRAWVALLVYAAFAIAAVVLISRATSDDEPGSGREATGTGSTFGPASEELALSTIGSRAQRSTVGVGESTGFVAWESNGLTLVLTARPAGGWKTRASRAVNVSYGGRSWTGTLVRTDPANGLGLVRVARSGVASALWDQPRRESVTTGERVAVVGRTTARTVEVARAGARRLYLTTSGLGVFAGAPVLNAEGRLVGVIDAGGAAVPIVRACGVIRRC